MVSQGVPEYAGLQRKILSPKRHKWVGGWMDEWISQSPWLLGLRKSFVIVQKNGEKIL